MLTLDGTPLDDPAGRFYVLAASRVRNPPAVVVNDVNVPGQHGVIPGGNGVYGPGTVTLSVRVRGGSYSAMMANYSALMAAVGLRRAVRTLLDTELSQAAQVQLVSISDLEQNVPRRMTTCTVTFSIPRSFWRDASDLIISSLGGASSGSRDPAELEGGSAPILDPVFSAAGNGGVMDLKITDDLTSTYFRYIGTVSASQAVRIEPDTASAWLTDAASPWTGGTDVSGSLTLGPGQFVLSPGASFTVTRTGLSSVQLRARRAYL